MSMHCVGCNNPLTMEEEIKIHGVSGICMCDSCSGLIYKAYSGWHEGSYDPKQSNSTRFKKKKISAKKALSVYRRDGFKCKKCGCSDDLTVDHVHPEFLGGTSDIDNLQTLCRSCNSSKGCKV